MLDGLVCLRIAMKFNDSVFEHYNDDENIDNPQSQEGDTDTE